MKPTRKYLLLVPMATFGLLSAYWAVNGQEGQPLFPPPAVLPQANEAPPAPKKFPSQTQPLRDKRKADPTLIIPAEVYESPRPLQPAEARSRIILEEKPLVVPASGTMVVEKKEDKGNNAPPMLPILPALDAQPLEKPLVPPPAPPPEPTKALIADPPNKDLPKIDAAKPSVPALPMPPQSGAIVPPPGPLLEPKKEPVAPVSVAPNPAVALPSDPIIRAEPLPAPVAPAPVQISEPKPAPAPPAPNPIISAPNPAVLAGQPNEPAKSFVRIRPALPAPPITAPSVMIAPPPAARETQQTSKFVAPPPPSLEPNGNALVSVQTPAVNLVKNGPAMLRAGESAEYQIVVRNMGPLAAQQARIEDEIPAEIALITSDPVPQLQGTKAIWVIPALAANGEKTVRLTLKSPQAVRLTHSTSVHVSGANAVLPRPATEIRPASATPPLAIHLSGPAQANIGQTVVFEIRIVNQSNQPLSGIVLHGLLPEGLSTPEGREIDGAVDGVILPGATKTLKMPTSAVQGGRFTVAAKVTTQNGAEASTTTPIEIVAESLLLQQAEATRLLAGRDGDMRFDVTNHTNRMLHNVAVAHRLPEGVEFVMASERGLFQSNSRTVHWLIDQLPAGKTQSLYVRVHGTKVGQQQNVVFAKAEGLAEVQSNGILAVEGISDLTMRVIDRDNPLEVGKETVYEVQVLNPGNQPAHNVQLQVQFPPGLLPRNAQGNSKYTVNQQTVVFEPLPSLGPKGQAIYRVSAVAQAIGDQRVRFAVASSQVRVPIQREISTLVYRD